MARPGKWSSPTTAIRVPAHLADSLIEIAKSLDQGIPQSQADQEMEDYLSFVQNSVSPKLVTIRDTEDNFTEHNYIVQAPPLSMEEWQQLKKINERLEREIFEGLSHDERLYLFSLLVQEVFPEHKEIKIQAD